jgi:hypothetical protein
MDEFLRHEVHSSGLTRHNENLEMEDFELDESALRIN